MKSNNDAVIKTAIVAEMFWTNFLVKPAKWIVSFVKNHTTFSIIVVLAAASMFCLWHAFHYDNAVVFFGWAGLGFILLALIMLVFVAKVLDHDHKTHQSAIGGSS